MKYSESLLGDVISIMRNFYVSSKASERSTRKFGSWLKLKLDQRDKIPPLSTVHETPAVGKTETQLSEDIPHEHPIILPGSFSMYCWEGITQGRLEQCNHGKLWGAHGPNCGPASRTAGFSSKLSSRRLSREDVNSTNPFGNTAFHSLARPWKLGGAFLSKLSKDLDLPPPFIKTARDNL